LTPSHPPSSFSTSGGDTPTGIITEANLANIQQTKSPQSVQRTISGLSANSDSILDDISETSSVGTASTSGSKRRKSLLNSFLKGVGVRPKTAVLEARGRVSNTGTPTSLSSSPKGGYQSHGYPSHESALDSSAGAEDCNQGSRLMLKALEKTSVNGSLEDKIAAAMAISTQNGRKT